MSVQIIKRPGSVVRYCPAPGTDLCSLVSEYDLTNRLWIFKAFDPNKGRLEYIQIPTITTGGIVQAITDYNFSGGGIYNDSNVLQTGTGLDAINGGYKPNATVFPSNGWYLQVDLTLTLVDGTTGCIFTYTHYLTGRIDDTEGDFYAVDFELDFVTGV